MGALGLTAAPFPTEIGGAGFSYLGWTLVMEELGRGRHGDGRVAVSPHPVAVPGRDLGHRRAAGALAAGDADGRGARGVRPDRATRGVGCGGDPDAGGTGRAGRCAHGVSTDRHEDLDLERARGRPLPRVRDGGSRGGLGRDRGVPCREGHGRVPVRGARAEDGDPGVPCRRARVRGLRGPGREPAGGRGGRVPDRAVGAGRGPDLDRGGVRGAGPGRAGGRGRRTSASGRRSVGRCPSSRACGSCSPRWHGTWRRRGHSPG